jgi:preprotein translocase subunit YajC
MEGGKYMQTIIALAPYILMLVVFYLIIFIPENKRKKKYSSMLESLKLNDEILTKGGIIGKIVNIKDDFVILETGPDRARIKLTRNGISSVLAASSDEKK